MPRHFSSLQYMLHAPPFLLSPTHVTCPAISPLSNTCYMPRHFSSLQHMLHGLPFLLSPTHVTCRAISLVSNTCYMPRHFSCLQHLLHAPPFSYDGEMRRSGEFLTGCPLVSCSVLSALSTLVNSKNVLTVHLCLVTL